LEFRSCCVCMPPVAFPTGSPAPARTTAPNHAAFGAANEPRHPCCLPPSAHECGAFARRALRAGADGRRLCDVMMAAAHAQACRASIVAALQHPKQLEKVEEEVDDVEVERDRREDVVVGAQVVHQQRRVVQDEAHEEQRTAQREDHPPTEGKVEACVEEAPDDEDDEAGKEGAAHPAEVLLGDEHVRRERDEDDAVRMSA